MTTISRRHALRGIAALPALAAAPAVAEGNPDAKIVDLFRQYLDLVDYMCHPMHDNGLSDERMDELGDQLHDVTIKLYETPAETALGVVIKLRIADPETIVGGDLAPADKARDSGLVDHSGYGHALMDLERMFGGLDHLRRLVGRAEA